MSDFYKRFLMEEGRRLNSETGRFVALAAFGKHPGWDDHIEDLGLETDSLVLARKVLYVQGVGGQIDTGAWEKLKEEHRLETFNHTFVWRRGDQFLIGRMWSSSDGKGRTRYPMIVCAHCVGVPLGWALEKVLPRLMEVENACQGTKSAGDVRAILTQARNVLANMVRDPAVEAYRKVLDPAATERFVSAPAFGSSKEGWFRILYWLQSQAGDFRAGKFTLKGDMSGLRAQQIRVPADVSSPTETVWQWTRFFAGSMDKQVPALYVWPAEKDWLDVTFGEPSTQEFFCLRASREAVAFATDIPYDFDDKFRERAAQQLRDFQSGRVRHELPAIPQKESPTDRPQSATQRWLKSLGGKFFIIIGLLLVFIAAGAVVFLKMGKSEDTGGAPPPKQEASDRGAPPPSTMPQMQVPADLRPPPAPPQKVQPAVKPEPAPAQVVSQPVTPPPTPTPVVASTMKTQTVALAPTTTRPAPETKPAAEIKPTPAPTPVVAPATTEKPAVIFEAPSVPATAREKILTNGAGMVLLWIAGLPGSREGGWVGKCEVRQSEYEKVTGSNPSKIVDVDQPVENVSWQEATEFCRKLSANEKAAGRLPASFVYALPTQQQWDFFLGSATFENAITSRDQLALRTSPARVATMAPNQYGLFDVLGNVWEWCADSDSPDQKMSKGGAFNNGRVFQFKPLERTTARRFTGDARSVEAGFRCVLVSQ